MMKKVLILSILLGIALFFPKQGTAQNRQNQVREQSVKYQRLMALIDAFYVDTVNLERLFPAQYCWHSIFW